MSAPEPERLVEVVRELFHAGGEWNYSEMVTFVGDGIGVTLSVGGETPAEAVRRAFLARGGRDRGRIFELFSDAEISRAVVES